MIIGNKYSRRIYNQRDGGVDDQRNACLFVIDPKSWWTAWVAEFLLGQSQTSTTCWMPEQPKLSIDRTLYMEGFTPIIFHGDEAIW